MNIMKKTERKKYEAMKMGELRKLFPSIKATRKKDFIDGIDDITQVEVVDISAPTEIKDEPAPKLSPREKAIVSIVSPGLMLAMHSYTNCDCIIENYEYFMDYNALTGISSQLQKAINKEHGRIKRKNSKFTRCASCLRRRINTIRSFYNNELNKRLRNG